MEFLPISNSTLINKTFVKLKNKQLTENQHLVESVIKEFLSVCKEQLMEGNHIVLHKFITLKIKFNRQARPHPIKGKMVLGKYPPKIYVNTSKVFQEDLKKVEAEGIK